MHRAKHRTNRPVVLVLMALLVYPGCAMTSQSPATSTITASLSYEVPASVDVKAVIDTLEEASTKTLRQPVTVDETAAPSVSLDAVSPMILQERIAFLEGLGMVVIPSVICPGALASMHTFMPSKTGIRLIANCVVVDHTGTRIYLADATTRSTHESAAPNPSHNAIEAPFLALIGEALTARLHGVLPLEAPDIPIHRSSNPPIDAKTVSWAGSRLADGATADDNSNRMAHAVPFVCFAPKAKGIVVRENPRSNRAVGTLDSDLIVQEEDPSKNSFLHITTREGQHGWVKRSDVRWTPCPIV